MTTRHEALPRKFGKYHLIERIGTGGMAELYLAKLYGASGFEKNVAIKKVLPHLSHDQTFINMFLDEAMITVTLNHGNIVSVIDFGRIDDEYFLVMEYVDGINLQTLISEATRTQTPLPAQLACFITIRVCWGLDYAHRKADADGHCLQIVHRDISPSNILLSLEGGVKIVDFGIAHASSRLSSTHAGEIKGKVGYMSPEQVCGEAFDNRSDIYSTGILLYEMLTNQKPYAGSTPIQTVALIAMGEYKLPHQINPQVDEMLSLVVQKAIHKDPQQRYQTASEMADALSAYLYKAELQPNANDLSVFICNKLPHVKPHTLIPTPQPQTRTGNSIQVDTDSTSGPHGTARFFSQPARNTGTQVLHSLELEEQNTQPEQIMQQPLTESMQHKILPAGSLIFHQGDPADSCCIIEKGQVEVVIGQGAHEKKLSSLGPGNLIGEVALIDCKPRSATVRCLGQTSLFVLQREDFLQLLHSGDQASMQLLNLIACDLAHRVRTVSKQYTDIFSKPEETISQLTAQLQVLRAASETNQVTQTAEKSQYLLKLLGRQTSTPAVPQKTR